MVSAKERPPLEANERLFGLFEVELGVAENERHGGSHIALSGGRSAVAFACASSPFDTDRQLRGRRGEERTRGRRTERERERERGGGDKGVPLPPPSCPPSRPTTKAPSFELELVAAAAGGAVDPLKGTLKQKAASRSSSSSFPLSRRLLLYRPFPSRVRPHSGRSRVLLPRSPSILHVLCEVAKRALMNSSHQQSAEFSFPQLFASAE